MIGTLNPGSREAHVVGAGVAGLLIAYRLDQLGYEVSIYEAASRVGGLIQTQKPEWGIAESAAHSLLVNEDVKKIFDELNIPLVEVNPASRARYIMRGGRLRRFPLRIYEVLWTFLKAYFAISKGAALSLQQWGERFIGRFATRYLLQPFVRGIYGAQLEELDANTAFPALQIPCGHSLLSYLLKKKLARAPKKPRAKMMAPRFGMQSLTDALRAHLIARLGARFKLGHKIESLSEFEDKNLILAIPSPEAFRLLEAREPELAIELDKITYTSLVSVTIFIEAEAFPRTPKGVGVLIPKEEKRRALGVLFNSSSFAERVSSERNISLTMILGGSADAEIVKLEDDEIKKIVNHELEAIFKIKKPALAQIIHRWPKAVPKYDSRLAHVWQIARAQFCAKPGKIIFTNYSGQVSLRGMIESVTKQGQPTTGTV